MPSFQTPLRTPHTLFDRNPPKGRPRQFCLFQSATEKEAVNNAAGTTATHTRTLVRRRKGACIALQQTTSSRIHRARRGGGGPLASPPPRRPAGLFGPSLDACAALATGVPFEVFFRDGFFWLGAGRRWLRSILVVSPFDRSIDAFAMARSTRFSCQEGAAHARTSLGGRLLYHTCTRAPPDPWLPPATPLGPRRLSETIGL